MLKMSMDLTASELKELPKNDVLAFIRQKLKFPYQLTSQFREIDSNQLDDQHRRFDMSGYEDIPGQVTMFNSAILNEFAYLGIYNHTHYLFLDFYKGTPTLYWRYWNDEENFEYTMDGFTTSEIIYEVFQRTIFSNIRTRRRI